MKPPIIVDESGSIDIFETVEDAENYLEVQDIENGIYIIYDRNGTILTQTVGEKEFERQSFLFFRTKYRAQDVIIKNGTEKDPERLKMLLKSSIAFMEERKGLGHRDEHDDLETLLARAIDLEGYTR